jgi:hypothetical protein
MGDMGNELSLQPHQKFTIFIFKIQKLFSGEGDTPSPHPYNTVAKWQTNILY